jgi:hypothetical protein
LLASQREEVGRFPLPLTHFFLFYRFSKFSNTVGVDYGGTAKMEEPKSYRQIYRAVALENYVKQASARVEVALSLKIPKYFLGIGFMALTALVIGTFLILAA